MIEKISLSDRIKFFPDRNQIKLSFNKRYNIINIKGVDYKLDYLDSIPGSKGGNSNVFQLNDPENDSGSILVIKFANRPLERSSTKFKRRFVREVIALRRAKFSNTNYIVKIEHYGIASISNLSFPFYTMEKAQCDIAKYLNENDVPVNQKLLLCLSIINGFKELHDLNIYHRDIKHDNVFMFNKECKVGDLGLVRFREDDVEYSKFEVGERIGAFGWESPETMNKYLTEKIDGVNFDCNIDSQSDIFQLGKLFWFIFQGNLPIGQIIKDDFLVDDVELFSLIFKMLQYSKKTGRRFKSIAELEESIKPIAKKYLVI